MTRRKAIRLLGAKNYDRLKRPLDLVWSYRKNSYSQNGEDVYLGHFFKGQDTGFYVDVGAFHPRQFSNTYSLYKRGWQGINIDANRSAISLFRTVRPRDMNVFAAISDTPAAVEFHKWGNNSGNTLSPLTAKAMAAENGPPAEIEVLETCRLADILSQHISEHQPIDLLNVDVEGLDLAVLKSNDWSKYRPRVVVVEEFAFSLPDLLDSAIYQYLTSLDYTLAAWLPPSIIFKAANKPQ
ncbi:MAG: FkbM family methyltransferase [Cyanobacteria bacterium Co-bin13]|nr:FkbM family methyltransferase [Cyanobacteria bacterium Co-bin13]